jgi:hypothetical protein
MSIKRTLLLLVAAAMLMVPAFALAEKPDNPGHGHANGHALPGPHGSKHAKAKAYGKYCQGESKKHVKGEKGTAFSRCVNAMAKATHGDSAKQACKGLSKKHVKGEKGTPYSRCVVDAAHAKHDADDDDGGPTGPTGPTGDDGAES